MQKAAESSDPLERLKWVVTFCIAGLHHTCALKKPFNPILGETYQGGFEDGTQVFVEQSSHHPPITSWLVVGPRSLYRFSGAGEWTASFRANSVKGWQSGTFRVDFLDGSRVTFGLPQVNVGGIMWGDRVIDYEGAISFVDEKNKLTCTITMPNPQSAGFLSSWFSSAKKLPSDHFAGGVLREGKSVSHCQGSWLGAIEFDGKPYWTWNNAVPLKCVSVPEGEALPSDSRFRRDIQLLKSSQNKAAAEAKAQLEDMQRRDAKLRKDRKDSRKASAHK